MKMLRDILPAWIERGYDILVNALKGLSYTPSQEFYEAVRAIRKCEAPNHRSLEDVMYDQDSEIMYGLAQQGINVPDRFRSY
ncbi:hypothetical protein KY328_05755 [Candidatus Woesearchaeota archaeon]|nr:hypothetical protein [Candidatus Woesearchaeota archaeon]MBW3022404.1 hypothetical protein [Candidatus Woesearchaeota archaeon]